MRNALSIEAPGRYGATSISAAHPRWIGAGTRGGTTVWNRCNVGPAGNFPAVSSPAACSPAACSPAASSFSPDPQTGHALTRLFRRARQSPTLLDLQLTIVTSLTGGSLVAAMFNLLALAALAMVRRIPNPASVQHGSKPFHV